VARTDWRCLRADVLLAHADVLRAGGREDEAIASLREAVEVADAKDYAAAERRAAAELEALTGRAAGRV
jgi:hypothetical protein